MLVTTSRYFRSLEQKIQVFRFSRKCLKPPRNKKILKRRDRRKTCKKEDTRIGFHEATLCRRFLFFLSFLLNMNIILIWMRNPTLVPPSPDTIHLVSDRAPARESSSRWTAGPRSRPCRRTPRPLMPLSTIATPSTSIETPSPSTATPSPSTAPATGPVRLKSLQETEERTSSVSAFHVKLPLIRHSPNRKPNLRSFPRGTLAHNARNMKSMIKND